jgi:hypothetical protein
VLTIFQHPMLLRTPSECPPFTPNELLFPLPIGDGKITPLRDVCGEWSRQYC